MEKHALLIGVSRYPATALSPLPAAVNDIRALDQVLAHPEIGGFPTANVTLLENPGRVGMETAIERLFAGRDPDDLTLLYFSGHGLKDDTGRLYLATSETRKHPNGELLRTTALPASDIHDNMERSHSQRQVIILDSCFSGVTPNDLLVSDGSSLDIQGQLGGRGRAILTAATASRYAFEKEDKKLSLYTQFLIRGIKTGEADHDDNGVVTVGEIHNYAQQQIRAVQPDMRPRLYPGEGGGDIHVAQVPPAQRYARAVTRALDNRGNIAIAADSNLEDWRNRLGLNTARYTAIESDVTAKHQKAFQEKRQKYADTIREVLQAGKNFADEATHLDKHRKELGLTEEDAQEIQDKVHQEELLGKWGIVISIWIIVKKVLDSYVLKVVNPIVAIIGLISALLTIYLFINTNPNPGNQGDNQPSPSVASNTNTEIERNNEVAELTNPPVDWAGSKSVAKQDDTPGPNLAPSGTPPPRPISSDSAAPPPPAPARLIVRSNVSGDTVTIDGQPVGPTGPEPHELPAGPYTVQVEKKGYSRSHAVRGDAYTPYSQPESSRESKFGMHSHAQRGNEERGKAPVPVAGQTFQDRLKDGALGPRMVVIPAGEFLMGSPLTEKDRDDDEGPQRSVRIAGPFALGVTEVTFADYNRFARASKRKLPNDRGWGRGQRPVINVSWRDAVAYAEWLSDQTGQRYRLPTEAEWEYAARAGTTTPFSTGKCISTDQANYDGNHDYAGCGVGTGVYLRKTVPAGTLPANPWGLHEMHGNVWEWAADCQHSNYKGAPADGSAWVQEKDQNCFRRVLRGGSWSDGLWELRSANRFKNGLGNALYNVGFRLAREL